MGHVEWSADGRSLIFTSMREGGNKMWRISTGGGEPRPIPIAEESAYSPSIAPKGDRLAYVREYFDTDLMRVELTANGPAAAAIPIAASARLETAPAFSPDGSKLAFFSEQSGRRELWMSNADGTSPLQMTDFFAWSTSPPSWSPDGRHLFFYAGHSPDAGPAGLMMIDVETKQVRRLPDTEAYRDPQTSRDGRWIFATIGELADPQVVRLPAEGGAAVPVTGKGALVPRESPDGRNLFYLKTTGGIWPVSTGGGHESLVLPDVEWASYNNWFVVNEGIYYVKPQTPHTSTLEFHDFVTRTSRSLATIPGERLRFQGGLTISPDRTWAVYSQTSRSASDIMLVENFR